MNKYICAGASLSKWKGRNQEPMQSNPRHQMGKEHMQFRRHKIRTARAESQEDSSFPADGNQAILNKMYKKSETIKKRKNIDKLE